MAEMTAGNDWVEVFDATGIAEAYGYGPGNLSVELRGPSGAVWWGCHAWWMPSALEIVQSPPEEVAGVDEIMGHVVTSAREGGDPFQHWLDALAANNLTPAEATPE